MFVICRERLQRAYILCRGNHVRFAQRRQQLDGVVDCALVCILGAALRLDGCREHLELGDFWRCVCRAARVLLLGAFCAGIGSEF
jgi:hypothetical protein